MVIKRVLSGILITLSVLLLVLQIYQYEVEAAGIKVLLLILFTVLYCYKIDNKRVFFLAFLLTFSIAEIINFSRYVLPTSSINAIYYYYYGANALYILAYLFLIVQMLQFMNVMETIKKFPIHLVVMIALDIFVVFIVTNTTLARLTYAEYFLEFVYNAVVMVLLTVALINYFDKDDQKAINLLIACIFIMFSEVIQLTYFYVMEITVLNVFGSLFLVIAFLFFYLQSRLNDQTLEEDRVYQDVITKT
ncbi:hypothetical protein [Gelidibacter salicanalis]|uniref:Uncharacterized protein n=1 Tax=Gelidibacter salicanalis TaxID=291193 RepID=A0A934NI64_9FLAO|nr:hypothetical protein [Gelidibacter salicanalis]MBJ7881701.1 hypothetical protein [Gelidibacter salicanalis]